jgi:transcriptional regulator with XRE-family HTH domain
MRRKDFGQLIAALRKEQIDEEGKQWTQERLAQESGLDLDVLGNIERGKRAHLKADMLLGLANAFGLTNEERREFFLATHAFDEPETVYRGDELETTLNELVLRIEHAPMPAYLIDSYCDILACNQHVLNLLGLSPDHLHQTTTDNPIVASNMMRFVFSPEFDQRRYMPHWHSYAYQNINIFRALSLRYRTEPYFQALLAEMRKWPLFRHYWFKLYADIEPHHPVMDNETIEINSPQWGTLSYFSTACTAMTSAGALILYVYAPADARTAAVFSEISQQSDEVVHRFGSWPEKGVSSRKKVVKSAQYALP